MWSSYILPNLTAIATIVLAVLTGVLAFSTWRLAKATTQPMVTATIEPNIWSMMHCDFIVENNGNAPAFDVVVEIDPEPKRLDHREEVKAPLRNIDVLRPNQQLKSSFVEVKEVLDKEFKIDVSWKRHPKKRKRREKISYRYHIDEGLSRLGEASPELQISKTLEKMQKDLAKIARK